MSRAKVLAVILVVICISSSEATERKLMGRKTLPLDCKVCMSVEIFNATRQGPVTQASCQFYITSYINSGALFKGGITANVATDFACDVSVSGGLMFKACTPVTDKPALSRTMSALIASTGTQYSKLLPMYCPAATATASDYVSLTYFTLGSSCSVNRTEPQGTKYCPQGNNTVPPTQPPPTPMPTPTPTPAPVPTPAPGNVTANSTTDNSDDIKIQNNPFGDPFCWICLTYASATPIDTNTMSARLNNDMTYGPNYLFYQWSPVVQPYYRALTYVYQNYYPTPGYYSMQICTSSSWNWASPMTNRYYDYTSDYLNLIQYANDYLTQNYNLGCKSWAGYPTYSYNTLSWTVSSTYVSQAGWPYPATDAYGTHYCAPPGMQDGKPYQIGRAC